MKLFSEPSISDRHENTDAAEIDLPDCVSPPPRLRQGSMDKVMKLSRNLRKWFPNDIPTRHERWKANMKSNFRFEFWKLV
jgi:hypothetical protein